jgi:hypothetical protein
MNSLLIDVEEKYNTYDGSLFLTELKDVLHQLDVLPINEVRLFVKSDSFKEERELIEKNFWKEFDKISKDDCSLDSALILQHYGFSLHRKPYNGFIELDEDGDIDEDL